MTQPAGARWVDRHGNPVPDQDDGMAREVRAALTRRRALGVFGSLAVAPVGSAPTPLPIADQREHLRAG
jgi:hypothetical protein